MSHNDNKDHCCNGHHHHDHAHHNHDHDEGCGCGHHHHEEVETITLTTDDGEELNCTILGTFDVDDKQYIALLPEDSEDVFIYGFSEAEDDIKLEKIESDEEYDKAGEAFMALWSEENEA